MYVTDGYIFVVKKFVRKHIKISKKIQLHGSANLVCKKIPFSNINDTEYTHLTKDLKFKPRKMTKETIFEKLNLFSDNENIKCKYYTTEQFKENSFDKHNNQIIPLHIKYLIFTLPHWWV